MPVPIIGPGSVTGTGVNLQTYRHRLADQIGWYLRTTVTTLAASSAAERVILCDELRDDEVGQDFLGLPYVYVASGDQNGTQRRIVTQREVGWQGPIGALMVSRPYTAALAVGTVIEVTSPLPVKRHLAVKGLNDCVNEALERIWVEVRVALTGEGDFEQDLAAYPWLTQDIQLRGIYDTLYLDPTSPAELSAASARLVLNGATRTLVTDRLYASGQTFYLAAIVRASRLIYDGTSWGYIADNATTGLQNDTHQAAAPEQWVLAFSASKAYQHIYRLVQADRRMDPGEKREALADLMRQRITWANAANKIRHEEFPKPQAPRKDAMVGAAPAGMWV